MHICGVSWNLKLMTLCFGVCVGGVGFVSSLVNKLLKYGFVGCLYLLLRWVQVQITGSKTLGGPREPH